ncbi:MAG: hypothetical protein QOC87_2008 [Actinomycetota bacterium]|nr:hypothetical protein [Actinomycetota bacterium]
MVNRSSTNETVAPSRSSTSAIKNTSVIRGTRVNVTGPGTINDAAMILRAEFLAPDMRTSPVRGQGPKITKELTYSL